MLGFPNCRERTSQCAVVERPELRLDWTKLDTAFARSLSESSRRNSFWRGELPPNPAPRAGSAGGSCPPEARNPRRGGSPERARGGCRTTCGYNTNSGSTDRRASASAGLLMGTRNGGTRKFGHTHAGDVRADAPHPGASGAVDRRGAGRRGSRGARSPQPRPLDQSLRARPAGREDRRGQSSQGHPGPGPSQGDAATGLLRHRDGQLAAAGSLHRQRDRRRDEETRRAQARHGGSTTATSSSTSSPATVGPSTPSKRSGETPPSSPGETI